MLKEGVVSRFRIQVGCPSVERSLRLHQPGTLARQFGRQNLNAAAARKLPCDPCPGCGCGCGLQKNDDCLAIMHYFSDLFQPDVAGQCHIRFASTTSCTTSTYAMGHYQGVVILVHQSGNIAWKELAANI